MFWVIYIIVGIITALGLGISAFKEKQYCWFIVDCIVFVVFVLNFLALCFL